MKNKDIKILIVTLLFTLAGCIVSFADSVFSVQPSFHDAGMVKAGDDVTIGFTDGTLATLVNAPSKLVLQYHDGTSWVNSAVSLTANANNEVDSLNVKGNSPILNKNLRILVNGSDASEIFYVAANVTDLSVPEEILFNGKTVKQRVYSAGDWIDLVPDIKTPVAELKEVRWQVSHDSGISWQTVYTLKAEDGFVKTLEADCTMTGDLYRYAVNPVGTTAYYEQPFEVLVYETFTVTGTTLTIDSAGLSGYMNDYLTGRLSGLRPWESAAETAATVSFDDSLIKVGAAAFRNFTALCEIDYSAVEMLGESVFEGCTAFKTITIPYGIKNIETKAFYGCDSVMEFMVYEPGVVLADRDVFPQSRVSSSAIMASSNNEDLCCNEHSFPVVYCYEGIPTDTSCGISGTDSGSTAYSLCQSSDLAAMPIGVILSDGREVPAKWDYELTGDTITAIKLNTSASGITDLNGASVHVPRSVDGHIVVSINTLTTTAKVLICEQEEHAHTTDEYWLACNQQHEHTGECYLSCPDPEHDHDEACHSTIGKTYCEKEEHTHDDGCYSLDITDMFGVSVNTGSQISLSALYIPDGVQKVDIMALNSLAEADRFFLFTKGAVDIGTNATINEMLYTYSANYDARKAFVSAGNTILDFNDLTGTTGDLVWSVDIDSGVLTIDGEGETEDYADKDQRPYAWTRNEISTIRIGGAVTRINAHAFEDFYNVITIINESEVLEYVSDTALANVGTRANVLGKTVNTPVNNALFDAITELNAAALSGSTISARIAALEAQIAPLEAEISILENELSSAEDPTEAEAIVSQLTEKTTRLEEINESLAAARVSLDGVKFFFVFSDTTARCGNNIFYSYNSTDMTLTISGDGEMTAFASSADVPWRAVNSLIRKVVIEKEVTSISDYAFNGLTALKNVFNYGKAQTITGGGVHLFDEISRITDATGDGYVTVVVPAAGSTEADKQRQRQSILLMLDSAGFKLTEEELKGWTLTCQVQEHVHGIGCYDSVGDLVCAKNPHTHDSACYSVGTELVFVPGTYLLSVNDSKKDVIDVLTGQKDDYSTRKYIVPVYTFGDLNQDFNACVPSEEKGYRLMDIYRNKGVCGDDLTYYVSLDDVLLIEGYGQMYDFTEGNAPWASVASKVTDVQMPEGMTSVGNYAFENFQLIRIFNVPSSVTRIGEGAFKDCINLYYHVIGTNVTSVGEGVFAGCSVLRMIAPENPERFFVNDGCFGDANGVLLGYLRDSLYRIPTAGLLFDTTYEYEIPNSFTTIGKYAFYNCSNLQKLTLRQHITDIHDKAFYNVRNLQGFDSECEGTVTFAPGAFNDVGTNVASGDGKYAIIYQINKGLGLKLENLGYKLLYHDGRAVDHITATYKGGDVCVGDEFRLTDVEFTISFKNGTRETVDGTDPRVSFHTRLISNVGDNVIVPYYDDGYGEAWTVEQFTVTGVNKLMGVEFSYGGSYVWVGDSVDLSYVHAKLEYSNGTYLTIDGNKKYYSGGSARNCITLSSTIINSDGSNLITASYMDETLQAPVQGTIDVKGKKYLTKLTTEYTGAPVEYSAGLAGLNPDDVHITIDWCDGTSSSNILGSNPMVEFNSKSTVSGSHLVFEYKITDYNRFGYTGAFSVPFVSNLVSVDMDYIGGRVTKGTSFDWADVLLTLHYAGGKTVKKTADTVNPTDIACDSRVINTADDSQLVTVTYLADGNEYTGTIEVPGKVRQPVGLVIVKRPTYSTYEAGGSFNKEGMQINCTYDDGQSENVTEQIDVIGGDSLTENTRFVTLVYTDYMSGGTLTTNLPINVNKYMKRVTKSATFKEEYSIEKVLFRSKETSEIAAAKGTNADLTDDAFTDNELGEWIDITPLEDESVYDPEKMEEAGLTAEVPIVKAGYGFEIRVYVRYRSNRDGAEFENFVRKSAWDNSFISEYPAEADEIADKWKVLNDIYPSVTPTTSPDVLFLRVINPNSLTETGEYTTINLNANGEDCQYVVLERTNVAEGGGADPSGEWYDSTKVFELPAREITNSNGEKVAKRRIYIKSGAQNDSEYILQICSPPWMGYEKSPYYSAGTFHYSMDEKALYDKAWSGSTPFLQVCYSFRIRAKSNTDITTSVGD